MSPSSLCDTVSSYLGPVRWPLISLNGFVSVLQVIELTKAFFSIFFTGMSMPMSAALVSHIVGYNMTWSTTVKTVEKSNFFLQIPIIWKRFYPQLVFFTLMVVSHFYGTE
jgi:hypothetical protein